MATIRTTCPTCGEVNLPDKDIWRDEAARVYRFYCPSCRHGVEKAADDHILKLLEGAGVLDVEEIVAREMSRVK